MSEAYSVFQRALTASVLEAYNQIPDEKTDETRFSPAFRSWITKTIRKTQSRSWYYVNTAAKKAILIAVIISLLAITAMAIPAIRKKVVEFFVHEHEEHYGITFAPEDMNDAPQSIKVAYFPTYIPEGYQQYNQMITPVNVDFWRKDTDGRRLLFSQNPIPEKSNDDQWIGIDSKGVEQTQIGVGEHMVTLFTDNEFRTAVWTDDCYFYTLNMDSGISLETMDQIILSIEPMT